MLERDFESFTDMLDEVASVLPHAPRPTAAQKAMFFRAVVHYTIAQVRGALDAHVKDPQRGRFMPVPADVVAQIEGAAAADGRPGAEEAWALLPKTEAESVVWTEEMSQAFAICADLMHTDRVAARMAFKEAYTRIVAEARSRGAVPVWAASLGHDTELRAVALDLAVRSGRMTPRLAHQHHPALPAPEKTPDEIKAEEKLEANEKEKRRVRPGNIDDAVRAAITGQRRDPVQWARDLRRQEESGERLSEALRMMWRKVLLDSPHAGELPGDFTPVPADCLPPGMRGGK